MITSAGAIGRLCIGGRPCRSALTGRWLAALLVNTNEQNCPQHGTDAETVPEMGAVGRRFAREQTARRQQQRMLRGGRAGSCRRRPAGNSFIVGIFETMQTSLESIVNNDHNNLFDIVQHCIMSLYYIVHCYCILLCIVIVYHCLLYDIVYCHCMILCIVIVQHCVLSLYDIVYCIILCIVIVQYSIVIV